ncbi:MAG: 16S rRNA (uracil(1498)-N(3))-methyltransferase [Anaerolineae bacterium]|nr:16S rRNA (uracil(1498)-N(3))-methyltransferase [Anaerolineae bacterium]
MTHRFFIDPNLITPPTVHIIGDTARQIKTVLRMQPGDTIIVLDNSGLERQVQLTDIDKNSVQGQIIAEQMNTAEPALHLTLYQGTLKGSKFEWVLQKGTEIGISCFVPTICQRSVIKDATALAKKASRWQQIIQEAAEQSGRGKLPTLAPACALNDALEHAQTANRIILPWEEAANNPLKQILANFDDSHLALFIGPEGGFSADEVQRARRQNAEIVSLGPRILRAETAALAASTVIFYEFETYALSVE